MFMLQSATSHVSWRAWRKKLRASLLFLRLWNREYTRSCCPVVWLPRLAISDFCVHFLELLKPSRPLRARCTATALSDFNLIRCVRNKAPQIGAYVGACHRSLSLWEETNRLLLHCLLRWWCWGRPGSEVWNDRCSPWPLVNLDSVLSWDLCYFRIASLSSRVTKPQNEEMRRTNDTSKEKRRHAYSQINNSVVQPGVLVDRGSAFLKENHTVIQCNTTCLKVQCVIFRSIYWHKSNIQYKSITLSSGVNKDIT